MRIGGLTATGSAGVTAGLMRGRFDPVLETIDTGARGPVTETVPRLEPNDVVGLLLENTSDSAVDFNILYIGADWSITFMGNGRLLPGAKLDDDFVLISDLVFGRDRMLVILTPASPQGEVEDLSFLEQSPLERARSTRPATAREGLAALLDEAGFGATSRGAVALKSRRKAAGPAPEILQFEIDTVPGSG